MMISFYMIMLSLLLVTSNLKKGKKELNVGPDNKLVRIYGGGFLLASKVEDFKMLVKECDNIKKQYNKDKKQFKQAIMYELANHEYHIRRFGGYIERLRH